jgi:hypothetical protein
MLQNLWERYIDKLYGWNIVVEIQLQEYWNISSTRDGMTNWEKSQANAEWDCGNNFEEQN